MDFALVFGIISFFSLFVLFLLKFSNAYLFVTKEGGQQLYNGVWIWVTFVAALFFWTIFFISTFAELNTSEVFTVVGDTTTTITESSNLFQAFFSFLRIANVFLVLIALFTFVEMIFGLKFLLVPRKRGHFKPLKI